MNLITEAGTCYSRTTFELTNYLFRPTMHHKDRIVMQNKKDRKVRKLATMKLKRLRLERRLTEIWYSTLNAWEKWTILLDGNLPVFEEPA